MTTFPNLFSPLRIGGLELANRLVMSPMENCYASREGIPSERSKAYFEARAKGGVGLITLGACTIDEKHREVLRTIDFGRDDVIAAHRELTNRVHAHGARIQPQLVHPGPDGLAPYLSGIPNIGPSVIPSYITGIPCKELEEAELPHLVDRYRAAAVRVREAGYDGIELHAAHGYMMLGSFLSPTRNRRTDGYAGHSEDGRIRLLIEVVRAIKAAAGEDFPLTLRISGYERNPGSRPIHDTPRIAPRLVEAGVDAFHVSGGVIDPLTTQMVTGTHFGPAHNVSAATAVKQVVDVPVMAVGRIHDPALAERILADERADLIAMGRPLLADPEFANKAREGRVSEIRRCISCENCIDSMEAGRTICAVNPFTGREAEFDVDETPRSKRIVILGGGPAGLEAARIATLRGHRVALYERNASLGGALVLAATVHPENQAFLDFLLSEVRRLRVEVHLDTELKADEVAALGAEVVLVATGGRLVTPRIPGDELSHVYSGALLRSLMAGHFPNEARARFRLWQRWGLRMLGRPLARRMRPAALHWLAGWWMPFGPRVVVLGGDLAAIELAEFLAERGRRVCVIESGDEIAPEVGAKRRTEHMDRLDRLGVPVHVGLWPERISAGEVRLNHGRSIAADSVIVAGGIERATDLVDALRGRVPELHALGDCTGLGLIRKATEDAARVVCAL
ncbi:MAG: FAD-dependent oxidoreductase [bacterium]|nr:NADH oxidase [Deltaproteobacteria bacterium]MCP4908128.1 FAD-dependent oxidoreductase [bacterium]